MAVFNRIYCFDCKKIITSTRRNLKKSIVINANALSKLILKKGIFILSTMWKGEENGKKSVPAEVWRKWF